MNEKKMPLRVLAEALPDSHLLHATDAALSTEITGVEYDSRRVGAGSLFVATVGEKFDGHDFVAAAVQAGAVAVEAKRANEFSGLSVPVLVVSNGRNVLAPLACRFWENPTQRLFLTGVTGTNGKTTTCRMIDSIARAAGDTTGVLGTIGTTIAGRELPTPGDRTTPEAPDLQRLFAEMLEAGCQSAVMEVASHALSLGRVEGCAFDVGVFTNLTQDHLDYHGTMEAYRDAKGLLFTEYADAAKAAGKEFVAVLPAYGETGHYYGDITRAGRTIYYAMDSRESAEIRITNPPALLVDRITFDAETPVGKVSVNLPFGGGFNVENALAAIGYGVARGLSAEVIAEGLATCPPVPGRFQPVRAGQEFAILVDYAHTPDGLENVLRSARPLTDGKLIVVFGCGGNRDRTKRPKMGKLALDLADVAVVTSDNPRRENPDAILDEILAGMTGPGAEIVREADRRKAVALAVGRAKAGDTVVIAGKGHETYQIVGDETLPFDDVQVATEEIRRCSAP